ncbi:hypothetical protein N665_0532s0083 [Sinapis alba]|nr:hypothetical protein N665_0532s0083 [Sinapis alba]
MSNPITAGSSSTTGGITGGRRQVRTPRIPSKCWCGESIIEVISKSRPNSYCWCYWCLYAASLRLENDDHVYKWIDEAFTDEIQQLDYQEDNNVSGGCHTFYLTLTIMNKTIICTYEIVYVPPADVSDFMNTLEFHVMQIVQRIDDVDLSIPSSS